MTNDNTSQFTLVEFGAAWCGPCRAFEPVMHELATRHPDISIKKIDVDQEPDLAAEHGIMSMPTTLVYRGDQLVDRIVGARPLPMMEAALERHRESAA
ncbi:thioredoxin family protein [Lysobacter korlensis]|uniref:Thioredoxin family protein n=1 Tax=Lysobacter korlensis TaxID=553636 RepID=A0ABV6RTK7_9GAMM